MITRTQFIPATETSKCFASAVDICGFEKAGYFEDEYYMYGTANVYNTLPGMQTEVRHANVPYVNRFVVRGPKDPAKFSGNVMVEIINASSGMEIERMWINGYKALMRQGDIFIGLTSKPATFESLRTYDAERYGCLSWPNPTPNEPFPFDEAEVKRTGFILAADLDINTEWGLFWDMCTDLPALLRSDSEMNPIRRYLPGKELKIVLSGWSQSSGYLRKYVNYFANNMAADPYDGYLAAGGGSPMNTAICQYEYEKLWSPLDIRVRHCRVPFMALQTESDALGRRANLTLPEDSDEPDFQYRCYHFTGSTHDTVECLVDYYTHDPDVVRTAKTIRLPPVYNGTHSSGNDYPYAYLFGAAYRNLFYWVREGVAPVSAPRMEIDSQGNLLRDAMGNTIGGLRTCMVNYPTAHYCTSDAVGKNGKPFFRNYDAATRSGFGYTEPYSPALLKELYDDLDNYRILCQEDTARQVMYGYICKEDAADFVDQAVAAAAARGLK